MFELAELIMIKRSLEAEVKAFKIRTEHDRNLNGKSVAVTEYERKLESLISKVSKELNKK